MADWDKISHRGNVEDRRGSGGSSFVQGVGGISLTGIVLILAVGYFGGAEPALELLDTMQQTQGVQEQQVDSSVFAGEDDYERFASTVLGSNDVLRETAFENSGLPYEKPKLVLFRGSTMSACGGAVAQIGPHYCPADSTIYLDETFFEEMKARLGAKGGDMAQAYVIAHEVGHHVQSLLGVTEKVQQARRVSTIAGNEASVRLELQADCYAGIWASTINELGLLEKNEIYEAIDAAEAVGDDRIQKRTTGTVQPESWTHGSSAQRKEWFSRGYTTGDFGKCNTFS